MWAKIVKERFGAENPNSMKIRFHTQTGGVTLQAQQPEVNIIRVALQGFAAVCGGTQSLHTNGFDEALALPTERSARIALRTQQVLAYESGAAETVDPFAGSYFVESLTDEIELRAKELMEKVEELGGSVEALEFMQREIEESAHSYHERYKSGQDVIVGVNKFVTDQVDDVDILKVDPEAEQRQLARLKAFKERRDQAAVDARSWRRCATSPAARATCCTRSAPRLPPTPRSARSAAPCATSSANTRAALSSRSRRTTVEARARQSPTMSGVFDQQLAWYVAGPILGLCVVACRALFNGRLGVTGGFSEVIGKLAQPPPRLRLARLVPDRRRPRRHPFHALSGGQLVPRLRLAHRHLQRRWRRPSRSPPCCSAPGF